MNIIKRGLIGMSLAITVLGLYVGYLTYIGYRINWVLVALLCLVIGCISVVYFFTRRKSS